MSVAENSPAVSALLHNNSQQSQQQQGSPPASAQHSSGFDNLTCQWTGCGERATSPENLYDHVCERHVGRKSTNNLNLQCQWGSCRTTTVKRDHITSHIRVHVPLKPHKCDFCGKSFKRPQDLKKHVKTHADDSVLLKSPDASGQRSGLNGYGPGVAKVENGMYNGGHGTGYGYHPSNAPAHFNNGATGGPSGNYGPVYYNMPQAAAGFDMGLTESRKRQHDALDAFFGEAKRRQIDPAQYMDLGAQFGGMQAMLSVGGGYGGSPGYNGYERGNDFGPSTAYQPMPVPNQHTYSMPFQNLKTKNDLMSIDQFLEQLQNTVYDHSGAQNTVRSGCVDPGLQPIHLDREPSKEPSLVSDVSSSQYSVDTPGSQFSGHSPAPNYSQAFQHRHSSSAGYPSLPTSMGETFMQQVPPSGIAGDDDAENRRRFPNSRHWRAQPQERASPRASSDEDKAEELAKSVRKVEINSANSPTKGSPPAIRRRDTDAGSEGSSGSRDSSDDKLGSWVNNMRTIEALRALIQTRLQQGQFEGAEGKRSPEAADADDESRDDGGATPKAEQRDQDYEMEDADKPTVAYPGLPAAA